MDSEDLLSLFICAAEKYLHFRISLSQVHSADDRRDLSSWQASYPDIDAPFIA